MSKNTAAAFILFAILLSGCGNVADNTQIAAETSNEPVAEPQAEPEPKTEPENTEPTCSEISFASDTITPTGTEAFTYTCDNMGCYVPSNFMVEIWEYACVKYLRECDYEKAQNNLKTMNWQCTDKVNFGTPEDTIEKVENALNEARNAKASSQTPFNCSSDFFTIKGQEYLECIK